MKIFKSKLVKDSYINTFWEDLQDQVSINYPDKKGHLSCRPDSENCSVIQLQIDGRILFKIFVRANIRLEIIKSENLIELDQNESYSFVFDKGSFPLYLKSGQLFNNLLNIKNAEMLLSQYIEEINSAGNYKFKQM